MVRSLTGTMIEAGRGRWTAADFRRFLEARHRISEIYTAPASGLFLEKIVYDPPIAWEWRSNFPRGVL